VIAGDRLTEVVGDPALFDQRPDAAEEEEDAEDEEEQ
jgi:hypothetical protein